jgi:hypothetical protein
MKRLFVLYWLAGHLLALPASAEELHAKLPGLNVDVTVELEGFRSVGEESVQGKTLFYGTIDDGWVAFSLVFEEGKEVETGAGFREVWKHKWELHNLQTFEGKDWSCLDLVESVAGGMKDVHYHAFRGIPGIGFHAHASAVYPGEKPAFTRDHFLRLVDSIRILDRRAEPEFPKAVADLLAEALKHKPDTLVWIREQGKARPDDYVPLFVLGMMALEAKDADRIVEGFGAATELLKRKSALTVEERFAWEHAEFSLGRALNEKGKFTEALPHAKLAYEQSGALKIRRLQGESAYALACCHAQLSDAPNAVKYLREAVALDASYGQAVKTEKGFDKIRMDPELKKLLGQ